MKRVMCLMALVFGCVYGYAQSPLGISMEKTTSLIFPFPIVHVDRGVKDVLVLPVKEADNILLVKAASREFAETNLTVVTSDGSLYSFLIRSADKPEDWVYYLPVQRKEKLATYANAILDNQATVRGLRDESWDMRVRVLGIYLKDEVMFFQLELDNQSPIDYDVEMLRFFIRDQKQRKRTAVQETDLTPKYIAGNTVAVKGYNKSVVVVALDKFTIPDAKYFSLQVMEKNGGRHLKVNISNAKIVKARVLPDLK